MSGILLFLLAKVRSRASLLCSGRFWVLGCFKGGGFCFRSHLAGSGGLKAKVPSGTVPSGTSTFVLCPRAALSLSPRRTCALSPRRTHRGQSHPADFDEELCPRTTTHRLLADSSVRDRAPLASRRGPSGDRGDGDRGTEHFSSGTGSGAEHVSSIQCVDPFWAEH